MAEALAVIGLVSAIVQFIDFGSKIVSRLDDFHKSIDKVPKAFRDLHTQLPLLFDTLTRTKEQAEGGDLGPATQKAVLAVVQGCQAQTDKLERVLTKVLPAEGDNAWRRGKKALASFAVEKEVDGIRRALQNYVGLLTYHQSTEPRGKVMNVVVPPKKQTPIFNVPFGRDAGFIGRESIMTRMEDVFKGKSRAVITGIGGVGKSQIAIESCYRYQQDHPEDHVFWVHCSNESRFEQAYKNIARRLALPGWDSPVANSLELVAEWFNSNDSPGWLLVLDNADDIKFFFPEDTTHWSALKYIPNEAAGRVLITSRDKRVGDRFAGKDRTIEVREPETDEALQILRHRLSNSQNYPEDELVKLVEALGQLPLAITQASAFISENGMDVLEYLSLLEAGDADLADLLNEEHGDTRRDPESFSSVARTWKLSFDSITKQKPKAAEMISLMAVLDRQGISTALLQREGERKVETITALSTLQAFSLITTQAQSDAFEIHRLVQVCVRRWLELQNEISRWQEEALHLINEKFPMHGQFKDWKACEALLPHATVVIDYHMPSEDAILSRAQLQLKLGQYNNSQGKFTMAYGRLTEALDIFSTRFDPTDENMQIAKHDLANVLRNQEKFDEAEAMFREVWETRQKTLGEEHLGTLATMGELALTCTYQQRYEEGVRLEKQVMEIHERTLGPDHPKTLTSIANLALAYSSQGRWADAEKLELEVLERTRAVLGEEHPDTLVSLSNLAGTYSKQGRDEEAEKLQDQALQIQKKVLGEEHPETLKTMAYLADIYKTQKRWEETEALYLLLIDMRKRTLGDEYPSTLNSMMNLASIYTDQNRWTEAEGLFEEVVEGRENVLGEEHYDTLVATSHLAMTYYFLGRLDEAEVLQVRVLGIEKRTLGEDDAETMRSTADLSKTYNKQGRWKQAEAIDLEMVEKRKRLLGEEDPGTLTSMSSLASTYTYQGRWNDARILYQKVVDARKRVLGEHHPATQRTMDYIASIEGIQDE